MSALPRVEPLSRTAETVSGRRIVVVCGVAVLGIETAGLLGGATVAVVGYAGLILVLANYLALQAKRGEGAAVRVASAAALLVVPFALRLVALTVEQGPVSLAHHYRLVGIAAVAALVGVAVLFPEFRPRIELAGWHRGQLLVAFSGLCIGLLGALALGRSSFVPQHGPWRSPAALLVLSVAAAVTEELLFRGYLQAAFHRLTGSLASLVGTCALLVVYLGVRPIWVVVVAVGLGLCSAVVVARTGRLEGVVVGRTLLYAGLFVIWPALLHLG